MLSPEEETVTAVKTDQRDEKAGQSLGEEAQMTVTALGGKSPFSCYERK